MEPTKDELMQDIAKRAAALAADQLKGETPALDEAQIRSLVMSTLGDLKDDDPVIRKMRFGAADAPLIGTKFARWNLGVEDIEFAFDLMNARAEQGKRGPSEELTKAFEAVSEAHYISDEEIKRIDRQAIDDMFPRVPTRQQRQQKAAALRAMDTAEAGYGAELVGAQYVASLWEMSRAENRIAGLIRDFEMTAPVAYLPVEVDFPEMLFVGESTTNNATAYPTVKTGTNRITVTAKKFVIRQMWSGEMEEDSIIPFVPFIRGQAAKSIGFYLDSLVLNGDTTNAATGNINLDDADPADTKHYLAFDGIRHAALVDNTANSRNVAGALDIDDFRALRGLMYDSTRYVDWGHPNSPDDLVYVADPATADYVQSFDDVVTWKQMNNMGSLLNGEIGRILGHPLISSPVMPRTEADGKVSTTPGNNTLGQLAAFNRNGFVLGWRRRVRVETERIIETDQTQIVYSLRLGFGRFTPTANANAIDAAAVAYNIT
jgi:HK97 family phage major capsid protein